MRVSFEGTLIESPSIGMQMGEDREWGEYRGAFLVLFHACEGEGFSKAHLVASFTYGYVMC